MVAPVFAVIIIYKSSTTAALAVQWKLEIFVWSDSANTIQGGLMRQDDI